MNLKKTVPQFINKLEKVKEVGDPTWIQARPGESEDGRLFCKSSNENIAFWLDIEATKIQMQINCEKIQDFYRTIKNQYLKDELAPEYAGVNFLRSMRKEVPKIKIV